MRRHVFGYNAAGADNRVMPNRYTLENDRSSPDPDPIFDRDRLRDQLTVWQSVLVSVHDDDITRNLAIAADRNLACGDDFCAPV